MRTFVAASLLFAIAGGTRAGDEWKSLLNGRDLTGWRANNDPESFKVENGILRIQAAGKTSAHLFYVGDLAEGVVPFKNFELEAIVKAEPQSNGGIYFHTDMATRDAAKHLARGLELQLNSSPSEARKTGSLYGVADLAKSPVDETQWFKVGLRVEWPRVRVSIDGSECVDYTQPASVTRPLRAISAEGGGIALQAHDSKSVWYFKELKVRKLP
jgi:hypothetical protein